MKCPASITTACTLLAMISLAACSDPGGPGGDDPPPADGGPSTDLAVGPSTPGETWACSYEIKHSGYCYGSLDEPWSSHCKQLTSREACRQETKNDHDSDGTCSFQTLYQHVKVTKGPCPASKPQPAPKEASAPTPPDGGTPSGGDTWSGGGDTLISHGFGDLCTHDSDCQAGLLCIFFAGDSQGYCTKKCQTLGASCPGAPAGTAAGCTSTVNDPGGDYNVCDFICKYGNNAWSCPSAMTCSYQVAGADLTLCAP